MQNVMCNLPSKRWIELSYGTRVQDVINSEAEFSDPAHPVIAAFVNNELVSLSFKIEISSTLRPVSLDSEAGMRIYRNSLTFLLSRSVSELFPERRLIIGHSLGHGYYFYFDGEIEIKQEDLNKIETRMREIVKNNEPIVRKVISYAEAVDSFRKSGNYSRVELLRFRNEAKIPVYESGGHREIGYQPLVPCNRAAESFEIRSYPPGFLLRYPPRPSRKRFLNLPTAPYSFRFLWSTKPGEKF